MSNDSEEALKQSLEKIQSGQYSEDDLWRLTQAQLQGRASITVEGDVKSSILVSGSNNTVTYTVDGDAAKVVREVGVKVDEILGTLRASTHEIYVQTQTLKEDIKGLSKGQTQGRRIGLATLSLAGVFIPALLILALFVLAQIRSSVIPATEPQLMNSLLNVAIARFGEVETATGIPTETDDARFVSAQVAEKLNLGIQHVIETTSSLPSIDVQYEAMPLIDGATPLDRQTKAAELAARIKADVLVYGYIDRKNNKPYFIPQFYISPGLMSAEEVTGDAAFGQTIDLRIPLASNPVNKAAFDTRLTPRLEALTYFMVGLAYIKADLPDQALVWFEKADNVVGAWQVVGPDGEGKEILYLWIGTAFHQYADQLAEAGQIDEGGRCWWDTSLTALDCAHLAYERAQGAEKDFARAYIGLGNLVLDEYADDCDAYAVAREEYETALGLIGDDAPDPAHVRLKTHYNMGLLYANTYRDERGCGYSAEVKQDLYDTAISHFTQAAQLYTTNAKKEPLVRELGARIYYQVGALYQDAGHYTQAEEAFSMCIDIATPDANGSEEPWQSIRWLAYHLRGYVYALMAKEGADENTWQQKALDDFGRVIEAYQSSLFESPEVVSSVFFQAGQIYEAQRNTTKAVESYQQAVDLADPDDPASKPVHDAAQKGLERLTPQT